MDVEKIRALLSAVREGNLEIEQALDRLRNLPYEDLGFARLDLHRSLRRGLPEVVLCQNKTSQQVIGIMERLWQHHERVLGTRASPEIAAAIKEKLPAATYDPVSRLIMLTRKENPPTDEDSPFGLVVSAGTSDLPVAEEAAQTLEFLGDRVERLYDVGVAGVHRLLDDRELLFHADVVIAVAGMEGALVSLVGGLAAGPVIGVPTSVGYGASFQGLAALLSMLSSCSPGVAIVNIDNGFGAGVYAHLILTKWKMDTPNSL